MKLDSLRSVLPDGVVSTDPSDVEAGDTDWWALSWIRRRRGDHRPMPAAVVFPTTTQHVADVLAWAADTKTAVVPRGGASGVVGGVVPAGGEIVLDLGRMDRVLHIDATSLTVAVAAGVRGDLLESRLQSEGLTTGHYPQSLSLSTVGGWVANGAVGHASYRYGSIDRLVQGLEAVLPGGGVVRMRAVPRSAAGPDLRRLLIGSEGTLGVITEVTLGLSRMPQGRRWLAFRFPDFTHAMEACRELAQAHVPGSIVRAYDEVDAGLTFGPLGFGSGAVMIWADDDEPWSQALTASVEAAAARHGAEPLPAAYGEHWLEHHTDAIDLYRRIMGEDQLFGPGVAVDTMEVAASWSDLPLLYAGVRTALAASAEMVGCHVSHLYSSGGSLYFTFMVQAADDDAVEGAYLDVWQQAVAACHAVGGTMTHHHGVGLLRASFMEEELGIAGLELLRAVKRAVDPNGIMNPGKLLA